MRRGGTGARSGRRRGGLGRGRGRHAPGRVRRRVGDGAPQPGQQPEGGGGRHRQDPEPEAVAAERDHRGDQQRPGERPRLVHRLVQGERAPLADARPGLREHRVPRGRPDRLAQPLGEHEDRRDGERPGQGHERDRDERQRVAREGQRPVAARTVGERPAGQAQHERRRLAGAREQADRRRARPERPQPGAEHAAGALVDDVAQGADHPEGDDEARGVQARRAGRRRRVGPRHHGAESGSGTGGAARATRQGAAGGDWRRASSTGTTSGPVPLPDAPPLDREPVSAAVHARLRAAILAGDLAPGDALPSERAAERALGATGTPCARRSSACSRPGWSRSARAGRRACATGAATAGSSCCSTCARRARGRPRPGERWRCARASAPTPRAAARSGPTPRGRGAAARAAQARRARGPRRGAQRALRGAVGPIVDGAGNIAYRLALQHAASTASTSSPRPSRAVAAEMDDAPNRRRRPHAIADARRGRRPAASPAASWSAAADGRGPLLRDPVLRPAAGGRGAVLPPRPRGRRRSSATSCATRARR